MIEAFQRGQRAAKVIRNGRERIPSINTPREKASSGSAGPVRKKIELPQAAKPKPNLKLFGTDKMPLRSSLLKNFVECPMKFIETYGDEFIATDRMQTGSAVHELIEVFEKSKSEPKERDYKQVSIKFPKSCPEDVREYFQGYVKQRPAFEKQYGKIIGIETQSILRLKAASFDPTQEDIVIGCTIDQLRQKGDSYLVIDFKVSQSPIADMVKTYSLQLAAYQLSVGAEMKSPKVQSMIMNPILMSRPRSVFSYPSRMSNAKCLKLLEVVQLHVAAIRMGMVPRVSGYGCGRCPHRSPEYC